MADAILMSGGVGGVTSDDVTARREHVLQGYAALTADSDDEVVQGTIPKRGTWSTASEVVNATGESTVHVRFEEGYYNKDGQYKPTAKIPYAVLTNVLGIDANKMLSNLTIAGTTGNIKMINTQDNNYRLNKSTAFGIDGWSDRNNPVFWIDFPHGNGYYHRADNHPHTCIDAVNLGTADANSVLQWQTATSVHGVKFEGAIQRWICTTGDVITALGGEGFAWDDTHANRGRGIVVRIPNGYYIQGANWAFLPSPNHLPHNIRKGVNINGTIGTMEDYGAGRMVFNGATFDGLLVSGVANKGFYLNGTYFAYNLNQNYCYAGIYNGGMNFNLSTGYPALKSRRIGCVLSQSINLTPFRQIVISYRTLANIQGNPYATLEAHVNRVSTRRLIDVAGAGKVDAIDVLRQGTASPAINRTGQIVINVADINEQAFISFGAYCNSDRGADVFAGSVQITKIDFLN